jgi:hypothetical protein
VFGTHALTFPRRLAVDVVLDLEQRIDAIDCVHRDRRLVEPRHVEELPLGGSWVSSPWWPEGGSSSTVAPQTMMVGLPWTAERLNLVFLLGLLMVVSAVHDLIASRGLKYPY